MNDRRKTAVMTAWENTLFLKAERGDRLSEAEVFQIADSPTDTLCALAALKRDERFGPYLSYSRKVFIPLTKLCRDVCHYCTFAHPPRKGERAYMTVAEAVKIARTGKSAG